MTSITGVSLTPYGTLMIQPPRNSGGNSAVVSIDPHNHDVKVTLNGQSEEFNPKATRILDVLYNGGSEGGDAFTDDTSLISLEYAYGSGNNFTGGTSLNFVSFLGTSGGNTYNAQGASSYSDVWEYGGTDTINMNGSYVQIYYDGGSGGGGSGGGGPS